MGNKVTNKTLWIFAIGQLGWSMLAGIVTNWFVYFYAPDINNIDPTHIIFIPTGAVFMGLTIIGLISAVGRIFDAITDPWIASKSDAFSHRLGRRIPFMRFAAIPFGIITILLFSTPVQEVSNINSIYIGILYIIFYLLFTIYCTPYNALIPVLGKTQENRTRVSTYISFTFILGTTISFALPNIAGIFSSLGYTNSFRVAVSILAVISIICMLVPAFLIDEKQFDNSEPIKTKAFTSLGKTFNNKQFRIFVLSDVLYFIAITMFNTGMPFYITSLLKLEESMTFTVIAIMTVCSLGFYPIVGKLSPKFGKKKMVIFAFVFFSFTFIFTALGGQLGLSPLMHGILIAVFASLPMAILGILPSAIIADIAESDATETKENREGMFYAARTFAFKFGQSFAMLLFTSVSIIGSESGMGLRLTALFACAFCLLGAVALIRYNEKAIYKSIGVKNHEN